MKIIGTILTLSLIALSANAYGANVPEKKPTHQRVCDLDQMYAWAVMWQRQHGVAPTVILDQLKQQVSKDAKEGIPMLIDINALVLNAFRYPKFSDSAAITRAQKDYGTEIMTHCMGNK